MCGIVYVRRTDGKAAAKAVLKRYERQKSRGRDGFGYASMGAAVAVKRAETEKTILQALQDEQASDILFHHRQPTSTPNLLDCTHPIAVAHDSLKYRYYLAHNGIIANSGTLKQAHDKLGFRYTTTVTKQLITANYRYTEHLHNDSEALAIDLGLTLEGRQAETLAEGSIAFVMVQADREGRPRRLYFGRNHGNPLVVERQGVMFALTSENRHGTLLQADTLYCYDYDTGATSARPFKVGVYNQRALGFDWYGDMDDEDWDGEASDWRLRRLRQGIAEYREALKVAEQAGETEEAARLFDDMLELEQELRLYQHGYAM